MELFSFPSSSLILTFSLALFLLSPAASGATFTFVNRCEYTVWPGILANAATPTLDTTGFQLQSDYSRTFQAPTGWSGRFWPRTGCKFDRSGSGSCKTGDCGSGQVECNGAGAAPPVTLAEFTLGTGGGQDFYDVSLVDGFNVPMIIEGTGGSGPCATTGCLSDLNLQCPAELRYGNGDACKSACEAFGRPDYCCSGEYNSPAACKPSVYAEMFKSYCPRSYSYAYDDPTSTFTCTAADYTMTFCPSTTSQKSSREASPTTTTAPDTTGSTEVEQGTGSGSMGSGSEAAESGSVTGASSYSSNIGSGTGDSSSNIGDSSSSSYNNNNIGGSGSGSETTLRDGSWLAGLAMGESSRVTTAPPRGLQCLLLSLTLFVFCILYL